MNLQRPSFNCALKEFQENTAMSSNLGNNDPSNAEEGQCERCNDLDRRWKTEKLQSVAEKDDQLEAARLSIMKQKHEIAAAGLKITQLERKVEKNNGAAIELEKVQIAYVELKEHSGKQAAHVRELQATILQLQGAQTDLEDPQQDGKPSRTTFNQLEEPSIHASMLWTPAQRLEDTGQTLATTTTGPHDAQPTTAPLPQPVHKKRERRGSEGPDFFCKRSRLSQHADDASRGISDDSGPNSPRVNRTLEHSRRFDSTQNEREYRQQEAMSKPSDHSGYIPSLKGISKADKDFLESIEKQFKDPKLVSRVRRELRIRKKMNLEELGLPYHPTG